MSHNCSEDRVQKELVKTLYGNIKYPKDCFC